MDEPGSFSWIYVRGRAAVGFLWRLVRESTKTNLTTRADGGRHGGNLNYILENKRFEGDEEDLG
jgi:hypothetical protein